MRTWLPEPGYCEVSGKFRPAYRWYVEDKFRPVPGTGRFPTAEGAMGAARDFIVAAQTPIRAERTETDPDPLGVDQWHQERAGRAAAEQERALGALIVKGRQVQVERRRIP